MGLNHILLQKIRLISVEDRVIANLDFQGRPA